MINVTITAFQTLNTLNGMRITSGLPQFGLDGYILSFSQLFFFSHRLDRLLIRFVGKRKIRSFNLVRRLADGILIPKLRQAVFVVGNTKRAFMAIELSGDFIIIQRNTIRISEIISCKPVLYVHYDYQGNVVNRDFPKIIITTNHGMDQFLYGNEEERDKDLRELQEMIGSYTASKTKDSSEKTTINISGSSGVNVVSNSQKAKRNSGTWTGSCSNFGIQHHRCWRRVSIIDRGSKEDRSRCRGIGCKSCACYVI